MKYRKSSFPYLCLLAVLIFGVPVLNFQATQKQVVVVQLSPKQVVPPAPKVLADQLRPAPIVILPFLPQ